MTDVPNLIITALDSTHDRAGFHCGFEALDRYLQKQARQDMKRRISRVYIAAGVHNPCVIIGYYTLSTLSIALDQLPDHLVRKLPKHPVPAALIGRLAVHKASQGQGVGKILLADAVKRTLAVSDQIAIYAMVVDAVDDDALKFYEQFGFVRLGHDRYRLFLPLKSIPS